MPPTIDVYVWLPVRGPGTLRHFIERYVDRDPLDERLDAFIRAYVDGVATDDDRALLAELSRNEVPNGAFSLYVPARDHYGAIITVTAEGATVLGLSIDDPFDSPEVLEQARILLEQLRAEFRAPAGCAGHELVPPQSRQEWDDNYPVHLRVGELPAQPSRART